MANYEHYKVFCKIAECKSISKAAEQLFVSQPAVSLAIKQLENDINTKLFYRTQKGVSLTVEGELLYSYVKQGCSIINIGEEKLKEIGKLQSGEIRVGASDMTLKYFILPYIEKFHRDYPQIKIKITNAPTPTTIKHMREGLIDFGVISGPVEQSGTFDYISVKTFNDILIAPRSFEYLRGTKLSAAELVNYPFIMLERGTSTRAYIEAYLKDNGVEIKPEVELATSDLIIDFVKRGMGFAFIMEEFAKPELENDRIIKIDIEPAFAPREFYILRHKNIPLGAAANKLIQYTRERS